MPGLNVSVKILPTMGLADPLSRTLESFLHFPQSVDDDHYLISAFILALVLVFQLTVAWNYFRHGSFLSFILFTTLKMLFY